MLIISFLGFLIRDSLGDPIRHITGEAVSEAERNKIREKLGYNDPFWVQYSRFLKNAFQGDLGNSFSFKQPVTEVILKKFPATIELVFFATLLVITFSFPIGIFSALKPRSFLAKFFMLMSSIGVSVPVFLTAIFLIYFLPVKMGILYSYGRGDVIDIWGWQTGILTKSGLLHLILPSVALSSIMLPLFIRLIRSEMMEVLESEYIRFAYAKGLKKNRILFLHALKNTLLPVISVGGVQVGTMIAYTILTESVFQWPGMGFMFLDAVHRSDTPLIVGYLVFVGLVFTVTNILVDLAYVLVNPTVKLNNSTN